MSADNQPDAAGFFGAHGGVFVAEPLYAAVAELDKAYQSLRDDPNFAKEIDATLATYVGRPSPIYHAKRLSKEYGCEVYLKREDLNHTGAHKINNAVGQIMLARRMGKTRIIAETGAGQHGVATATVCAREGMPCTVYMGAEDIKRQAQNVQRMRLLGAQIAPVKVGTGTLKDALNEAMRDWVANVADTYYLIGSVAGPHPYPLMVRDFNAVVGRECVEQMPAAVGAQPDAVIACVGGGSNALGILHGMRSYLMQDADGQISGTSSIAAGLDYPAVGPEHAWLHDTGRVRYAAATDDQVLAAFTACSRLEGILPALESAHALAYVREVANELGKDAIVLVNLSGRGDKDLATVLERSDD